MGVISSRIRRHRRTRLAAEMACTWNPRRLFPLGQEQGGVYYPDNPDALLRRVNLLSSTATLSTQSITATPRQQTLSFKGTGTVTLSGASTAGPLVGTGASDRVSLTFTPTAASLTLTVTGTVTEAQLELGPAFTTYQPVTTWTTDYMAAVGHLVTQFTDSAGTTPVTKVTDPVGLTLDRRFGGARGVELFADGGFSSGVSDLPNSARGTVALGSNTVVLTTTSVATTEFGVVAGAVDPLFATAGTYEVQIVVSGWSVVNSIHRLVAYASQSFNSTLGGSFTMNGVGTYSGRLTVAAGDTLTIRSEQGTATIGDVFTLSRISARLVPGNHRIQATSGSRKTLSARYNQLLATQQFANAAWLKTAAGTGVTPVVVDNAGTDPEGGSTASRITFNRGASNTLGDQSVLNQTPSGAPSGGSYKRRVWFKAWAAGDVGKVILVRGTAAGSYVQVTLTNSWQLVEGTEATVTAGYFEFGTRGTLGSSQTVDVLVWGPDSRTADDAAKAIPAYQRVNTSTDYDTDGFPHFWLYDGTDDSDATAATVDGSAHDKVTVIAGVTKNSDAATGMLLEHTASAGANSGSFYVATPNDATNRLGFVSKGTTLQSVLTTSAVYNSPVSFVVTGQGDIGADVCLLRANGVTVGSNSADQGTGNYANATTYWGRRGGSTLPFEGREYSSILRFGSMSDSERAQAERWTARLMGINL